METIQNDQAAELSVSTRLQLFSTVLQTVAGQNDIQHWQIVDMALISLVLVLNEHITDSNLLDLLKK